MADIFPPDATTPLGQIRYSIDDVAEPYLFSDAHLTAKLSMFRGNLNLAAADIFESIAVNEALLGKYVKTDDLLVDGTKVADVLFKRAASLRAQDAADAAEDAFEVVYPPTALAHAEGTARWLRSTW